MWGTAYGTDVGVKFVHCILCNEKLRVTAFSTFVYWVVCFACAFAVSYSFDFEGGGKTVQELRELFNWPGFLLGTLKIVSVLIVTIWGVLPLANRLFKIEVAE